MSNAIKIGPSGDVAELSQFGRNFVQGWEPDLKREERAASGKLRRDRIARKHLFTISYELADQIIVDRFDELYQLDEELILEVTHLTEVKTYSVLMGEFDSSRLLATRGGMWEGVSVEFREI
jgi:hypothetical protein